MGEFITCTRKVGTWKYFFKSFCIKEGTAGDCYYNIIVDYFDPFFYRCVQLYSNVRSLKNTFVTNGKADKEIVLCVKNEKE